MKTGKWEKKERAEIKRNQDEKEKVGGGIGPMKPVNWPKIVWCKI